jgi:hypothetical protein
MSLLLGSISLSSLILLYAARRIPLLLGRQRQNLVLRKEDS